MLLDVAITMMDKLLQELESAEAEKRQRFTEMGLRLIQISTDTLKNKT